MAKIRTNQTDWKFVGGRLCLDFVNTVGGRVCSRNRNRGRDDTDIVLRDKLADFSHLLEWSRFAGVANRTQFHDLACHAAIHRQEAYATLSRAVTLREALYRIFKSAVAGGRPPPADLEVLSRELRKARMRERIIHSGGAFRSTWEERATDLDRLLWPIALSAADLLTSGDLSRLRQCGGSECGWMFLDISRNRSRQWCDMKDCGNREKVRRFRKRQQRNHGRMRA